jgi:acyl dehydratase
MTDRKMTKQYLEDYAVGQVYRSGRLRIDKDQIIAFAAQFDPQSYHLDEAAARKSVFGGLAASGWHTAALTMRLPSWKAISDRRMASLESVSTN